MRPDEPPAEHRLRRTQAGHSPPCGRGPERDWPRNMQDRPRPHAPQCRPARREPRRAATLALLLVQHHDIADAELRSPSHSAAVINLPFWSTLMLESDAP